MSLRDWEKVEGRMQNGDPRTRSSMVLLAIGKTSAFTSPEGEEPSESSQHK